MGICSTKIKEESKEDETPVLHLDILHERIKKRLSEDTPPNMINIAKTTSPESKARDFELKFKDINRRHSVLII